MGFSSVWHPSWPSLYFYARPSEILDSLRHVHLGYLGLGTLGIIAFLLLRAIRWRFMLNNAVPYSQVFHIQNIGYMLTQLLPCDWATWRGLF